MDHSFMSGNWTTYLSVCSLLFDCPASGAAVCIPVIRQTSTRDDSGASTQYRNLICFLLTPLTVFAPH